MLTDLMPASTMVRTSLTPRSVPSVNKISFDTGSITSELSTLPIILSAKLSICVPFSTISVTSIPSCVPQSCIVTLTFCATSISFRVRYPAFAVLSAVSARPLRAPWVEMKYSFTFRPSLKFEVIGVSMIEPSGLLIRPLMPASCLICSALPRAPLSAII